MILEPLAIILLVILLGISLPLVGIWALVSLIQFKRRELEIRELQSRQIGQLLSHLTSRSDVNQ